MTTRPSEVHAGHRPRPPVPVATGMSDHADAYEAGREATAKALAAVPTARVLLCFSSVQMAPAEVLRGVGEVAGDRTVLGGSSAAVMTERGWRRRGVAVMALDVPGLEAAIGLGERANEAPVDAGREAAEAAVQALGEAPRTLMIFPEGGAHADHHLMLDGLHAGGGGAVVVGGASVWDPMLGADDPQFLQDWQYFGPRILENAVPVLGLGWRDGEIVDAFAKAHGFAPIGLGGRVTRADGHWLEEIDGRPAIEYFRRYLGEQYEFEVDNPLCTLGLVRRAGAHQDLFINTAFEVRGDGAIWYYRELPVDAEVQLVRTTRTELLAAANEAAEDLKRRLGGARPLVVFAFSCGGRQAILGSRCEEELARIQAALGPDVPLIGNYAGGEFCPLMPDRQDADGPTERLGVANAYTLTLYALAEPAR